MENIKKTKAFKSATAISLCLALGLSLTGCSTGGTVTENQKQKPAVEQVAVQEVQAPENRTFEPYEHVFYLRYDTLTKKEFSERVYGGQIVIPEGYEILEIENFNEYRGYGSQTRGFDVWFINTKKVEVKPVYNEAIGAYDYSEAGTVIEEELVEEDTKSLTLNY